MNHTKVFFHYLKNHCRQGDDGKVFHPSSIFISAVGSDDISKRRSPKPLEYNSRLMSRNLIVHINKFGQIVILRDNILLPLMLCFIFEIVLFI